MKYKHLLAKNSKDPQNPEPEETLVGHTRAVLSAADEINSILLDSTLSLFDGEVGPSLWADALFLAAWLHDLGKANDHFQSAVRNKGEIQGVRHETLGAIAADQFLKPQITEIGLARKYPNWFWHAVIFALAGHHLKFPDKRERPRSEVIFLGDHPEIHQFLDIGHKRFGLSDYQPMYRATYSLLPFGGIEERLMRLRKEADREISYNQKLFVAALKATLMCSDLAGSALPRSTTKGDDELRAWVKKRLLPVLRVGQLDSVVKQKLKGSKPRNFQQDVSNAETKTVLVEAGCGSGKTAAAYLWAEKHSKGKRLFFCYPTTTTASEGFAGYLRDPDFEAILVNSRAEMDYRLLPSLPGKSKSQIEIERLDLEAIETWPIPVVVCTAHTVLGLLQNERRGIYAWPSIVRSAFVFDEVHSFSPRLFTHLLRFLEIFRSAPVLLMTATLPSEKKNKIDRICQERGGLSIIEGPEERERSNRYELVRVDKETAYEEAKDMLLEGGKVLWICNTVAGAMTFARKAFDGGFPVQPFHSRYRYRDRVQRQKAVVTGFEPMAPPVLAVTTQVAEMSLDLSADLLISEYAPPASMIQRLGRLNRFQDIPDKQALALFYKPSNALPYAKGKEEIELWRKVDAWFSIVADGMPKSQKDLAAAFVSSEKDISPTAPDHVHCDWFDDPPVSISHRTSLMEPGYTIEVVRQEDLHSGHIDEMVIPMPFPRGDSWQSWPTRGRYVVAPSGFIQYDIFWGASYGESQPEDWII